jgi:hypothetical protein
MAHSTISEHILEALRRTPDCRLDDLVLNCQHFPLQAVLSEVSRLSRKGQLQLTLVSTGYFTLQLLSANYRQGLVERAGIKEERIVIDDRAKPHKVRSSSIRQNRRSSARVSEPISVHLTCSETELEA